MTMAHDPEWFARCVLPRIHWTPGCWLWTGHTRRGYGSMKLPRSRRMAYAHRVVYEQLAGPIPDGLQLDHVRDRGCTSKRCVRPDHLEPVDGGTNTRRHHAQTTHCPAGHAVETWTGWKHRHGKLRRYCRACDIDYKRAKRAALRLPTR